VETQASVKIVNALLEMFAELNRTALGTAVSGFKQGRPVINPRPAHPLASRRHGL
jgi:hypothetical protein